MMFVVVSVPCTRLLDRQSPGISGQGLLDRNFASPAIQSLEFQAVKMHQAIRVGDITQEETEIGLI
jgi:hypothetical protein